MVAIFGLVAVVALGLFTFLLYEKHRLAQFSRTYERPLKLEGSALYLIHELETPQSENSLRFIVMPAFGPRWFAVAVASKDGLGSGEVIVQPVAEMGASNGLNTKKLLSSGTIHRRFIIPPAELRQFLKRWDDLTDDYSGEGRVWTDGVRLSFERKKKDRITSGSGNSPCHEDVLGNLAAQELSGYAPELQELRAPWLNQMLRSDTCNPSIFNLR